ncbi:MAG: YvcK family protein, partial [Proteobacteria bacterium]|nr:YvcK family protein [Pseudomonadota bacterium]
MSPEDRLRGPVLALCGGIGGAKLALGLYRHLAPGALSVAVNTGDDFEHLGLHISPDIDTVLYTLSGTDNPDTGWGRADETWTFMAALEALGGETWFRLGDGDLALHVERTRRLGAGESLSEVCAAFARRFGLDARILPMTGDPLRTVVHTPDGPLPFQHYFVRERCEPRVTGVTFAGAEAARPSPEILRALADPALAAVVICPSNPYLSIDPILAVPGIRIALGACPAPV